VAHGSIAGAVLDVGLSSMQLADVTRGFSFGEPGPLDMRMAGADGAAMTAADVINSVRADDLSQIIKEYSGGGERYHQRIAEAIVSARSRYGPIATTEQLAGVVSLALQGSVREPAMFPAICRSVQLAYLSQVEGLFG
jgi:16S rRNA (cytosine1402-N4)-methyltransferase